MPDPNQTDTNTNQVPAQGSTPSDTTTPPVPDFQSADSSVVAPIAMAGDVNNSTPSSTTNEDSKPFPDQGSSAPSDLPPMTPASPKKKFGGGKIIATILGFLILTGGIAGGVILTQQQQDIREKAASCFDDCYQGGKSGNTPGECNAICAAQTNNQKPNNETKPYCSRDKENDCAFGCTPTVNGGSCKPNPNSGGGGGSGSGGGSNSCPSGQTFCTDSCYSLSTSSKNCGACGKACPLTYSCNAGVCTPPAGCTTDNDCPINGVGKHYACQAGKCLVDTSGVPGACASNNDCANGSTCVNKQCIAGGSCSEQVKCDDKGCYVGNKYDGAGSSNCVVWHYKCPNNWPAGQGCQQNGTVGSSATFQGCGTEQIDIKCDICGASVSSGYFRSKFNQGSCSTTTTGTPPPGGSPVAQCQNIKAYSETWSLLNAAQLSQLKVADKVNFCVAGTTTQGTFDKAKFTINSVAQAETTTQRPSSTDFCQLYTIPAGTTTFNITAQIHHATLDWK